MKITIINSSPNSPSNSTLLGEYFMSGVLEAFPNASFESISLTDLQLEHFSLKFYEAGAVEEPSFIMLKNAIMNSDALVITTPVWNFGVPAQLKNMIDRMGSFAYDRPTSKGNLKGMPLYIIFTGGAPMPAWTFSLQKTTSFVAASLQYFGATPVGTMFEPQCTKGKGVFGCVVQDRPNTIAKCKEAGKKFGLIVNSYVQTGALPTKENLQGVFLRTGEKIMKALFG